MISTGYHQAAIKINTHCAHLFHMQHSMINLTTSVTYQSANWKKINMKESEEAIEILLKRDVKISGTWFFKLIIREMWFFMSRSNRKVYFKKTKRI